MINFFLIMSLNGTMAFLIYFFFQWAFRKRLQAKHRYFLLKCVLFFFLCPLPVLSEKMKEWVRLVFPDFMIRSMSTHGWSKDFSNVIIQTPEGFSVSRYSLPFLLCLLLCAICSLVFLLKNYTAYRHMRAALKLELDSDAAYKNRRLCAHGRTVLVYRSSFVSTPFCYGFFQPVITLPTNCFGQDSQMLFEHELQHIRACDFLTRVLSLFVIALHFYNPFSYLLFGEISRVSELACDEAVVKNYSKDQKKDYGRLLIDLSGEAPAGFFSLASAFKHTNYNRIQERIMMLKHPKKTNPFYLTISVLALCFISTVTTFAYEPPRVLSAESISDAFQMDMYREEYDEDALYPFNDPNEIWFRVFDTFFISDDGTVSSYTDDLYQNARSTCIHSYQTGSKYSHLKNKSGGCTYTVYSIKKCKKCGYVKSSTLISSAKYVKCPH